MEEKAMRTKAGKGFAAATACLECGGQLTASRGNYRYTLADDWGATVEGVELLKCKKCGTTEPVFDSLLPMQRAIAAAVVRKPTRLAAQEVKFLRTHLGRSAKDLAGILGVTPASVSRWENGKEPIGVVPDRLLRTVIMLADADGAKFEPEQLAAITDGDGPMRLTVRMRDGHWEARSVGKAA
jgi:putative zinc finger/helix-turn-helix YgiT family protein